MKRIKQRESIRLVGDSIKSKESTEGNERMIQDGKNSIMVTI